jgi:hypothetical protein
MKLSEYIKNLQSFMDRYGDLDCWYETDDEGNEYHPIVYEPSLYCIFKHNGEVHDIEDTGWLEMESNEYDEICVVN